MSQVRLTVYVPSTFRGADISERQFDDRVQSVSEQLSGLFGGATIGGVDRGTWLNDSTGAHEQEKIVRVHTICEEGEALVLIDTFFPAWADSWGQWEVLVTVEPISAYFIAPGDEWVK